MKFLLSKNIYANTNFVLLISLYTLFMLFYFAADLIYLGYNFGFTLAEVNHTLIGNEDEFIEPMSFSSILEFVHIALFLGTISIFTSMAIILRLDISAFFKKYTLK